MPSSLDNHNPLLALGTKISLRTRRRLDALKDAGHPVNISAVCQEALDNECDYLETETGVAGIDTRAEIIELCELVKKRAYSEKSNCTDLIKFACDELDRIRNSHMDRVLRERNARSKPSDDSRRNGIST